jgi:glycosyltransferase involved in cell wall biosynthesis
MPTAAARGTTSDASGGPSVEKPAPERRGRRPWTAPDFIVFAGLDWWYHNRAHSDFQLATRLGRDHRVLLVNSIAMRMPLPGRSPKAFQRIARKAASMARALRRPLPDRPGFHVLTPLLLPFYGSSFLRRLNAGLVRVQVALAARWLGIQDPVILVTVPTAWDVVRPMRRRMLVFNRSDKHSAFHEANGSVVAALENELLAQSQHVLYVSHALMAQEVDRAGDRARWFDHGVDLDHFRPRQPTEEPADMRRIPRPRIGFFGGLDDYVIDFALVEKLARVLPHCHVVLIGDATCPLGELLHLPNVHWLGYRPYQDIPRYGSGFDVAIMPWLDNDWIRHCNPIKLKEYLALGLPVVSMDYPGLEHYRSLVRTAHSHEQFIAHVRELVTHGDPTAPAARRAAVATDSWEHRVAELLDMCRADATHVPTGGAAMPTATGRGVGAHPGPTRGDDLCAASSE